MTQHLKCSTPWADSGGKILVIMEICQKNHFCGTIEADLTIPNFWHFLAYLELAPIVPQKCYAPKSSSTISFQLIQVVIKAKLSLQTCFI